MNYISRAEQMNIIIRSYNQIGQKLNHYLTNNDITNNKSGLMNKHSRNILQNIINDTIDNINNKHLQINIEDSAHSIYLNIIMHDAEFAYIKRQLCLGVKEETGIRLLWLEMREIMPEELKNKLITLSVLKKQMSDMATEISLIEHNYM